METEQLTTRVIIPSSYGLGTSLARRIVALAQGFDAKISFENERGRSASGRSMYELLLLGASPGESLALRCVGFDARAAGEAIEGLFASGEPTSPEGGAP